jgi:hypothetical protein
VWLALFGLPGGRLDYTAFAHHYDFNGDGNNDFHAEIDLVKDGTTFCDPVANTNIEVLGLHDVGVCLTDYPKVADNGGDHGVAVFQFKVSYDPLLNECVTPVPNNSGKGLDDNPDANTTEGVAVPGTNVWPQAVTGDTLGDGTTGAWDCSSFGQAYPTCAAGVAFLGCGSLNGPFDLGDDEADFPLGVVHFNAIANGVDNMTLSEVVVNDEGLNEIGTCNPGVSVPIPCTGWDGGGVVSPMDPARDVKGEWPDIGVDKSCSPLQVLVGGTVSCTVLVGNVGGGAAPAVLFQDLEVPNPGYSLSFDAGSLIVFPMNPGLVLTPGPGPLGGVAGNLGAINPGGGYMVIFTMTALGPAESFNINGAGASVVGAVDYYPANDIDSAIIHEFMPDINVVKMDVTNGFPGTPANGWTMDLYSGAGSGGTCPGTPIATGVTASGGIAAFDDLAVGTYCVKETLLTGWGRVNCTAPKTFVSDLTQNITIDGTQKDFGMAFCNSSLPDIKVKKMDVTTSYPGSAASGWTMDLYDNAGCTGTPIDTKVTDGTGVATFADVALDTYCVKEQLLSTAWGRYSCAAPKTYISDLTQPNIVVDGSANVINLTYCNSNLPDLVVTKLDKTVVPDVPLNGWTMDLHAGACVLPLGPVVASGVTLGGTTTLADIVPGAYCLQEDLAAHPGNYKQVDCSDPSIELGVDYKPVTITDTPASQAVTMCNKKGYFGTATDEGVENVPLLMLPVGAQAAVTVTEDVNVTSATASLLYSWDATAPAFTSLGWDGNPWTTGTDNISWMGTGLTAGMVYPQQPLYIRCDAVGLGIVNLSLGFQPGPVTSLGSFLVRCGDPVEMVKVPAENLPNANCVQDPADPTMYDCNLWLCKGDDCNQAKGQGSIVLDENVVNVLGDAKGVGAFEFQVKFDHKIFDITVCEGDQPAVNGVCPDGNPVGSPDHWLYSTGRIPGIGDCSMTIITENDIRFACVSKNPNPPAMTPGPVTDGTIATLTVKPDADMYFRLTPGQNNGVVRTLLDENCELANVLGDPLNTGVPAAICGDPPDPDCPYHILVPGVNPGGDLAVCGDATLTVRILEGDLNTDCQVDVVDDQAIAFRYGAFFGNLLYDPWFDLEPALKDFDIDIKDLQKVFGRNGSTCENPIPSYQTPQAPPN